MIGDPNFDFDSHDLPIALRQGHYSRMTFAYDIDDQGRMQNCAVTVTSGNSEIDALTCKLASERARFVPATDAKGRAIASHGSRTVSWSASVFGEDMARCAVASATDRDQVAIMRWLYAAIATSPQLKDLMAVTPAKLDELGRQATSVFQRVIFQDCRRPAIAALRNGGMTALMQGFYAMGMAAGRQMMLNPQAMVTFQARKSLWDPVKLAALAKEAGVPLSDVTGARVDSPLPGK